MRIHRVTRSARDERGATAVIAAVLAMVLVGVAAFTVDFGRAYLSKRQLQNASDAGALAAAAYYAEQEGSCPDLRDETDGTDHSAEARLLAEELIDESRPGATLDLFEVSCGPTSTDPDGELVVTVSTVGETGISLGGVYGVDSVTTQRAAEATVEVPETIGRGLRPYAMCSHDIPKPVPSDVVKVNFPGTAHNSGPCPTSNNPGNWWTVNCPEDASNSNAVLEENTRNGCEDPISIVEGQPPIEDDAADNLDLTQALLDGCDTGPDEDCLNAVTGNINGSGIWDAWNTLLGKEILLPVFCGDPTCVPGAVVPAPGNNTNYPVHRFVAVTVCGYHWGEGSQKQGLDNTTGDCAGHTLNVTAGGNSENYILLAFSEVLVTGSTADGDCALDSACDGGARQIRLTE